MKSEFVTAITQLAAEKGVPREMVMEAIQQALVSAYKQHEEDSRLITAEIDSDSGEPHVYHWLTVVEDIADDVEDDSNLIILEQARRLKGPDARVRRPPAVHGACPAPRRRTPAGAGPGSSVRSAPAPCAA